MAIQYLTYNDDSMESGKFYLIEGNKDLVSNVREITSITEPIAQNTAKIEELENTHYYTYELKFENERYVEMTIPRDYWISDINIFETVRQDDDFWVERDMTHSLHVEVKYNKLTHEKIAYTHSHEPISGRMVIIIKLTT